MGESPQINNQITSCNTDWACAHASGHASTSSQWLQVPSVLSVCGNSHAGQPGAADTASRHMCSQRVHGYQKAVHAGVAGWSMPQYLNRCHFEQQWQRDARTSLPSAAVPWPPSKPQLKAVSIRACHELLMGTAPFSSEQHLRCLHTVAPLNAHGSFRRLQEGRLSGMFSAAVRGSVWYGPRAWLLASCFAPGACLESMLSRLRCCSVSLRALHSCRARLLCIACQRSCLSAHHKPRCCHHEQPVSACWRMLAYP